MIGIHMGRIDIIENEHQVCINARWRCWGGGFDRISSIFSSQVIDCCDTDYLCFSTSIRGVEIWSDLLFIKKLYQLANF